LKRFFFHSKHTQKLVVNGRFSVNLWGWISAQGPGVLTHIISYPGEYHAPISECGLPPKSFYLSADNCPIHIARIISYWMEQEGIRVPPWPSRSMDLNSIENV
jgi:hypothetical protein